MPDNPIPPATALTFIEWAQTVRPVVTQWGPRSAARAGWDARQPEIDALRERERELTAVLNKLEWVVAEPDGSGEPFCILCGGTKPCHAHGCQLAELLAAKEGA